MVKLTEILEQFPWNSDAPEEWSDKEIYTHTVHPEDMSNRWSVPIFSCLNDFAYVGFRIRANIQLTPSSVTLLSGDGKRKPLIGTKEDIQTCGYQTLNWTLFKYPLPARLLALDEDEPVLEVTFPGDVYGKVEFLAQKFDELEAYNKPLWFSENDFCANGTILTPNGQFYRLATLTKRVEYPHAVSIYSLTC
jgi:hypothetical protein